jgi:CubicO group peptidase (beta-lactamase class C family)
MRIALILAACMLAHAADPYFPGRKWRTATPESQGIDSAALAAAVDAVMQQKLGVHSILVIRHGHAVLDASFYPYDPGTPHDMASVTKSITSSLTGIAVAQGLVKLETPLLSLFPKEAPANPDEQKKRITVENLLHMESGLDCGFAPGEKELEEMKRSPNWVQFALGLPMKYDPGTHSAYCSPGYHLLASVVASAAKQSELEFARKNLFGPLGIRDVIWPGDPQGRTKGWGDSHLYPQDAAKLGYLYLHGGKWDGKQIVDPDWVAKSVVPSKAPAGAAGNFGYLWRVSNGPNGLQYGGTGRGGQSLIVWPELDTIVVITAGGNGGQIAGMIRKAVKSEPLAANPEGDRQLAAKVAGAAKTPAAEPVAPLPPIAKIISGKVYEFPVNSSRIDSLALTFGESGDAKVAIKYLGEDLGFPVGLDGRYRLGPNGPFRLLAGARGKWTSDTDFLLDLNFIANINHYTLAIKFEGEGIQVTANEASGLIRNGKLAGVRRR